MATAVDTLLLKVEADLSDLKRNLQQVERRTQQSATSVERSTQQMKQSFQGVGTVLKRLAPLLGAAFAGAAVRSIIRTGSQVEKLKVQMTALFGSAQEGARAFETLTSFASQVPFSLEAIQQGASSLVAVAKDAGELREMLQITGNIASQFPISFQDAAANVQRVLATGITSAELFRDRGVKAFAGFQDGVSYSTEESIRILQSVFGTGGRADGAMKEFAKTSEGAMSMLSDGMMKFRLSIAQSGALDAFTALVGTLTEVSNSGESLADTIGTGLKKAFEALRSVIIFIRENLHEFKTVLLVIVGAKILGSVLALGAGFATLATKILLAKGAIVALNAAAKKSLLGIVALGITTILSSTGLLEKALKGVIDKFEELAKRQQAASMETFNDDFPPMPPSVPTAGATKGRRDLSVGRGVAEEDPISKIIQSASGRLTGLQLELQGMGSLAVDAFSKVDSLTVDQFRQLQELEAGINSANEAIRKKNENLSFAKSLIEETKTPHEIYIENLEKLRAAAEQNATVKNNLAEAEALLKTRFEESIPAIQAARAVLKESGGEQEKLKMILEGLKQALVELGGANPLIEKLIAKIQVNIKKLDPMYKTLQDASRQLADSVSRSFADMVVNGKFSMDSFKDLFKSFVAQVLAQAIKMFVIKKLIGSAFPGFASFMGFGGGGVVAPPGSAAAGAMGMLDLAEGGRVYPRMPRRATGGPVLVGERGPELFVPSSVGSIKNLMDTRNIMGNASGTTVVNQSFNIETGVSDTVR
ncbi:MAG: hypothetical protein VW683_12575, partial [Betaproteobacteria bacterium]